jgi:hypothetical protein
MTSQMHLIESYVKHVTTDNFIDSIDINRIYVLWAGPSRREAGPTPPNVSLSVKVTASSVYSQQSPIVYWKSFRTLSHVYTYPHSYLLPSSIYTSDFFLQSL